MFNFTRSHLICLTNLDVAPKFNTEVMHWELPCLVDLWTESCLQIKEGTWFITPHGKTVLETLLQFANERCFNFPRAAK